MLELFNSLVQGYLLVVRLVASQLCTITIEIINSAPTPQIQGMVTMAIVSISLIILFVSLRWMLRRLRMFIFVLPPRPHTSIGDFVLMCLGVFQFSFVLPITLYYWWCWALS